MEERGVKDWAAGGLKSEEEIERESRENIET